MLLPPCTEKGKDRKGVVPHFSSFLHTHDTEGLFNHVIGISVLCRVSVAIGLTERKPIVRPTPTRALAK